MDCHSASGRGNESLLELDLIQAIDNYLYTMLCLIDASEQRLNTIARLNNYAHSVIY
jgi:hypothetical protein